MSKQTLRPRSWADVKAGDVVAYRRGRVVKRMYIDRDPHVYQDTHAKERQLAGIQGLMVNKDGSTSKVQPRFGAHEMLNLSSVVEVTGERDWVTDVEQAHAEALAACPAGHADAPMTDGGTCAECEQPAEAREVAKVGTLVQRRGEEGPLYPLGRVGSVAEGSRGPMVNISFSRLPGLWTVPQFYVRASREAIEAHADQLVKEAAEAPAHVRDDCPALPVGGCVRCTAPATAAKIDAQPVKDVHTGHCCKRHGCKYSYGIPEKEAACTVVSGRAPQEHPCEQCGEPDPDAALEELEKLREDLDDIGAVAVVRDRLERAIALLRGAR